VSLGDLEFDFSQADPRYAVTSQATRTVNVMLVPIFDQGQYVVNIVGVNMDITERKKAEKALAQNEARLRSLVESQTALVVRTDIRGDFTYVSPSWLKRFGWMKERFIGTPSLETLLEEDRPKALEVVIWCIEHPGESTQIVLRKPTQEGIVVHTLWEFIGITDGAGNVTEIQCVGFDVTAQMLAEQIRLEQERLKASLKKEREFNALVQKAVAALAHDIRTPLTAISTARDVLDMYFDRLDEDRRREKLDSIKRQLQYVLMLLNDMSLTVKGSLDQHFFQPAPVNLRTLCQITVSELQQSIGGKHRMVFITDEQIDVALIDETLVSRILLNLLSNAVKFSPHGKEIILELTRRADRIVLRVIDHGIGISKEDQRHLFEPFFRSESVRGIGGTGLGLSIVKDCVERHQGTLHVESVLGQGTTFALELPILNP
jgi:PAS domain S-box-containing protein